MTDAFSSTPSRRTILTTTAAGLIGASVPTSLLAAPAKTRFDIASASGKQMATLYAKAVTAMQDPAINYPPQPQSWLFQSFIHGVPINPFDPANSNGLRHGTPEMATRIDELYGTPAAGSPQATWKSAALECWGTCTHGSPYFTVWHRWYIYYFERICRTMCKDPSFTLPYWNYASNQGASLKLPDPFVQSGVLMFDDRGLGFANPAGTGLQNVAMNDGGYMPFPSIDYQPALGATVMWPSDTAFFAPPSPDYTAMGFSGRLECVPHDMVHDSVGGWMGNVPSAAGDPVFYVHHCQVDRLYASWEVKSGISYNWGTSPTQPSEADWKGHVSSFVDETGKIVKVKMGDAIQTSALSYGYDTLAKPKTLLVAAVESVRATASATPSVTLAAMKSGALSVGGTGGAVILKEAAPGTVAAVRPGPGAPAPTETRQTLVLHGMTLVRRPPAPLSVFLNLPKGGTPDLTSPFYVGTINLFRVPIGGGAPMSHDDKMAPMDHDAAAADLRFDVSDILARQRERGLWDGGQISVTVTTVGTDRPADVTYVTFSSISLVP